MSTALDIGIEGIGVWAAGLPDWNAFRAALAGKIEPAAHGVSVSESSRPQASRPAPSLLAPTERRRAPESVLMAIEAAQQACAMAGRDPRDLPNVFASAYGDLEISDYLCATLARTPHNVSPTRFHNSVHNAPAGYWTIATGCMQSSTAISAGEFSFGAGLLEAGLLAISESTAVLFVAYDVAASGALTDVLSCRSAFATALVLVPPGPRDMARLHLQPHTAASAELAPEWAVLHPLHRDNPAARCLPLLTALAARECCTLTLAAGTAFNLRMEIQPWSK